MKKKNEEEKELKMIIGCYHMFTVICTNDQNSQIENEDEGLLLKGQ